MSELNFNGMYRGIVVDNYDPAIKGQCKIYVPGVYPEKLAETPANLPWAEPVMPLFGGDFTNKREGDLNIETGVTTIPHNGANLWLFFEQGDQNYPKYFGAVQGGAGWHSEHNNQHVIHTDNVRVRVDENPQSSASTCKFDSYNAGNNERSQKKQIAQMPTRVDVEIWNEGGNAINLIVKGNVNLKIDGDLFEDHTGDKHLTHTGNVYKQHDGDVFEVHNGDTILNHKGKINYLHKGDSTEIHTGTWSYTNTHGDRKVDIKDGELNTSIIGGYVLDLTGPKLDKIKGDESRNVVGSKSETITALYSINAFEAKVFTTEDILGISNTGNIIFQAFGSGPYNTKLPTYPNLTRGGIIFNGNYLKRSGKGDPGGVYIYEYIPALTMPILPTEGIVDNTGTTIQHDLNYSPLFEYDILQA